MSDGGGTMVVDDCDEKVSRYDAAFQAYKEFVSEIGQSLEIVQGKLGIAGKG